MLYYNTIQYRRYPVCLVSKPIYIIVIIIIIFLVLAATMATAPQQLIKIQVANGPITWPIKKITKQQCFSSLLKRTMLFIVDTKNHHKCEVVMYSVVCTHLNPQSCDLCFKNEAFVFCLQLFLVLYS